MILSETENIPLFIVMERKYSWGFITCFCCGCALKKNKKNNFRNYSIMCDEFDFSKTKNILSHNSGP